MPITRTLQQLGKRLATVSETPSLDAQVLLAHILELPRTSILAHPEITLTAKQSRALQNLRGRLEGGEPLPYVLGHWEFYGLDFNLSSDVLIPRPETELLVEQALSWLREHPGRRRAADIGTGTGCIAIALAANLPDLQVWATDISPQALKVAHSNVQKQDLSDRVYLLQSDLLDFRSATVSPNPFDLIAANLPYIPTSRLQTLEVARREPRLALDGGADGMDLIRRLLMNAPMWLAPGGCCLLEIDASQGEAACELAQACFPSARVSVIPDLAGLDRLVVISLPKIKGFPA